MQCQCGATTTDRSAVYAKKKQCLDYVECKSCRRCGNFTLFEENCPVGGQFGDRKLLYV